MRAVRIEYDPKRVSYERLLEVFWRNIDPLDGRGQFCDKGAHYTSAIYALDDEQLAAAQASKALLVSEGKLKGKIKTETLPAGPFYPAEDYHQDYYKKNPIRYKYYRWGCGRDARLKKLWGRPNGRLIERSRAASEASDCKPPGSTRLAVSFPAAPQRPPPARSACRSPGR